MPKPLLTCAALLVLLASAASAQVTAVIYYHAGDSAGQTVYRRHDDVAAAIRSGPITRVDVPDNGQLCFDVRYANPVLYRYSASGRKIDEKASPELTDLTAAVRKLSGIVDPTDGGKTMLSGGSSTIDDYPDLLGALYNAVADVASQKKRSDGPVAFRESAIAIARAFAEVERLNMRADETWKEGESGSDAAAKAAFAKRGMLILREHQQQLFKSAKATNDEFQRALNGIEAPACVKGGPDKQLAVLQIKYVGSDSAWRATGDSVVQVEMQPVLSREFDVGLGIAIFDSPRGAHSVHTNSAGNLEVQPDGDSPLQPMTFFMGRLPRKSPVWLAIGATVDKSGVTSWMAGPVLRVGILDHGPHLTLGLGYGLTRVTVGLKDPTLAGRPVPSGSSVDDLTDRRLRASLGMILLLSGLK